jgi:hypothetical protein
MELTEPCIIGKGKIIKIAFPLKSGSPRCSGVPLRALTLHSKVCSEKREGTPSGSNRERSRRDWIDDGIRTCLPNLIDHGRSFLGNLCYRTGSYLHRGWHCPSLLRWMAQRCIRPYPAMHRSITGALAARQSAG